MTNDPTTPMDSNDMAENTPSHAETTPNPEAALSEETLAEVHEVVAENAADSAEEAAAEVAELTDASAAVSAQEIAEAVEENAAGSAEEAAAEVAELTDASADAGRPPMPFKRGDLVTGSVASVTPLEIKVDLGDGITAEIMSRELERMTPAQLEEMAVGSSITVYVVNPRTNDGKTLVSINRAAEETDWRDAEEYRTEQKLYEGAVAGFNKGGLIVRFGRLRGFVPLSQMSEDRRRQLQAASPDQYDTMVNQPIIVKVMEVSKEQNRLILSERLANRENREKRKEELISKLEVGQRVSGKVVSLEDFGAFVDVGGAEGLVHLTELSWKHVTHPKDLLKVGQTVNVEVISVDADRKRIGLSIKRTESDPWDEIASTYQVGQLVRARITKLTKFGAFARLVSNNEIEGLVHISELSESRVNHPRDVVNEGDTVTLRVIKVDVRARRLGLSLKKVSSSEFLDLDLNYTREDE